MTKRLDIDAMDADDAIDLVAQLDAVRNQLDRDTHTLEILADIKDDLRRGIARRQLRMELIDADTPIDDLIEAVEEFREGRLGFKSAGRVLGPAPGELRRAAKRRLEI